MSRIANTIGKESKISPVFHWPEWTCKEEKLLLAVFPSQMGGLCWLIDKVGSGGRKPAVPVELGMADRSDHCVDL